MFCELCIQRRVVLHPSKLCSGLYLNVQILNQLLEDIKTLKATEDHGYYVIATTLEKIEEGKIRFQTGAVVFPVEFKVIVFKPYVGEILHGEVIRVLKRGCFLDCGPFEEVFLHVEMMTGYEFHPGETQELSRFRDAAGIEIKRGSQIRFKVHGLKWFDERRGFHALASINGDFLGVISSLP